MAGRRSGGLYYRTSVSCRLDPHCREYGNCRDQVRCIGTFPITMHKVSYIIEIEYRVCVLDRSETCST